MSILAEDSAVISKTKELCAQIASDPSFLKLQADVERFLADDSALYARFREDRKSTRLNSSH